MLCSRSHMALVTQAKTPGLGVFGSPPREDYSTPGAPARRAGGRRQASASLFPLLCGLTVAQLLVDGAVDARLAARNDERAADLLVESCGPHAADDGVAVAHLAHGLQAAKEKGGAHAAAAQVLAHAGGAEVAAPAALVHGEAGDAPLHYRHEAGDGV